MKNNSQNLLSVDCRSTVSQLSVNCRRLSADCWLADCWSTVGQQSADYRPTVVQQSVLCLSMWNGRLHIRCTYLLSICDLLNSVGRLSVMCRQCVGNVTVACWPAGYRQPNMHESHCSLLPKNVLLFPLSTQYNVENQVKLQTLVFSIVYGVGRG